ncbi:hypothetical protein FAUST_615 [Fusarium austroamericanum]|uniref:Protein kinase domain-containing protein n=1 Tax=Fusarium austroamericanum TaxID=282268 RepID=A0AAN6CAB0_FUSAU|nr:hypothetical protein FAUST_615 [Fusarium austroamericanum]
MFPVITPKDFLPSPLPGYPGKLLMLEAWKGSVIEVNEHNTAALMVPEPVGVEFVAVVDAPTPAGLRKGIQFGYIDTGETYIFLHIPDDPSCVYYSVCVPSLDVQDDDETRLHRTAVAQAFAFVLQAIRPPPPCQAWHDAAEHLDTWAVEYEDVLRSIPATDRKPRCETPYKAQRWKGLVCSPIRTRFRCLPPQDGAQPPTDDSEDDDDDESPSPTPNPTVGRSGLTTSTDVGSSEMQEHDGSAASQEGTIVRPNIQDRPYYTHECLRGLSFGGSMDEKCPNLANHAWQHAHHPARDLEGMFVPVCLGNVHLTKPYYYDSGVYEDFMFLSYSGRPFLKHSGEVSPGIANEILAALGRLHQHGVLHHDVEPRNVLYDKRAEGYMIVDLMMAEFHNQQPIGPINVNGRNQKRK